MQLRWASVGTLCLQAVGNFSVLLGQPEILRQLEHFYVLFTCLDFDL